MEKFRENEEIFESEKIEIKVEPFAYLEEEWETERGESEEEMEKKKDLFYNLETNEGQPVKEEIADDLQVTDGIVNNESGYSNYEGHAIKNSEALTLNQDSGQKSEFVDSSNISAQDTFNEHHKQITFTSNNSNCLVPNYLLNGNLFGLLATVTGSGDSLGQRECENTLFDDNDNQNCTEQNLFNYGNSFDCEQCEKSFRRKHDLKRHLLFHSETKPFICNLCGKPFKEKRGLKGHMVIHSDVKPFTCEICNRSFKVKCALRSHLLFHSDSKPFTCEICEKSFKRKDILQEHMLSHSDEKPLVCEVCHKSWKRRSDLKRHMVAHSDARPFMCHICSKCFKDKRILKKHMLSHNNMRSVS